MPLHAVGVGSAIAHGNLHLFGFRLHRLVFGPAGRERCGMGMRLWMRDRSGVGLAAATTAGWFIGLMVCVTAVGRV